MLGRWLMCFQDGLFRGRIRSFSGWFSGGYHFLVSNISNATSATESSGLGWIPIVGVRVPWKETERERVCVFSRNTIILVMEETRLTRWYGYHIPLFFPGFVHLRLFGSSSINSIPWTKLEISGIRHNSKGGKPWQMTSWLAADLSGRDAPTRLFHDLALRSKECPIYGVFDWHKGVKHGRHLVWPLTWGWKLSVVGQILIDSMLEIVKTLLIFWKGVVGMWLLPLFFVPHLSGEGC